jgi:hypothetical protein
MLESRGARRERSLFNRDSLGQVVRLTLNELAVDARTIV